MSVVFDSHSHCFPPLGSVGKLEDRVIMASRLAEHQYHVRFHGQGMRRQRDNIKINEWPLSGKYEGLSWQPQVDFRIGKFGRLEFTHNEENCYIQWMPPTLWDMSSPPEYIISQMDSAGVDRAFLQHDRIYGRLDDYLADCVRQYPDRLIAGAQVDEWIGGRSDQLERLDHQINDLGFSALYFSTGGFFHDDFKTEVNDQSLEPLWELVADLRIPIHWYAATSRRPFVQEHTKEIVAFTRWAKAHPHIPSVLTHGLENVAFGHGKPDRFEVPKELITLLQLPNWHVELMLHIMHGEAEFPPHSPQMNQAVQTLVREVGAEKLMWGSDMPACERTVTYKQSMLLFQTQCDFLTTKQREAILGDNLAQLYPP